ncbi:MAG: hypothetical protein QOG64_2026 [Acidimicrobiaceae bacterium]|nr:hypothetical protein [Acidimicrobiaceae bacterium]
MLAATAGASVPGSDARLSNDSPGTTGYVSNYTLNTGHPYTDDTLTECNKARGRQNEPAVAIDPRNTSVVVGSSNDYCGVYDNTDPPAAVGAIWLGYYRSQDGGRHFQSSLVPGYPDDRSPYRARAQVRTASSGDPVMAWDREGRLFMGSESSGDPAGTKKTLGDVWVASYENPQGPAGPTARDGQEFKRSVTVDKGSSAPNLLGNFNDKTALEVDRTGGPCDGNVYFSWSRFTGNGGVSLDFARSTDHGRTFPKRVDVSTGSHDVQFPDISVTGNGHVYVTYRQFSDSGHQTDALMISKSTDCGASFSPPQRVTSITPYDASDVSAPQAGPASKPDDPASAEDAAASGSTARDCGDFSTACSSGYTFFRRDTQVRSTADQKDKAHEWVYMVYDPSKPGTEVNTGTSYGSVRPGVGSQSGVFFLRYDGASGSATAPKIIDNQATGHQLFPDIAADAGQLHTIWWDSRNDACYSPARPVGNCADRSTVPSLDAFASQSSTSGSTWSTGVRLSDVTSNPNYEQFSNRAVPFAGDYLWIDAVGSTTYGVWTDWRNTVAGSDAREGGDGDHDGADVLQCRTQASDGSFSSDQCPRAGGLDQDIYGDTAP